MKVQEADMVPIQFSIFMYSICYWFYAIKMGKGGYKICYIEILVFEKKYFNCK